jgi:hypothetical protein
MVRYFYAWIPYVAVGTVVFLSLPWLGLIALFVVALLALAALAAGFVVAPYLAIQAISRHMRAPVIEPELEPAPAIPARRLPVTTVDSGIRLVRPMVGVHQSHAAVSVAGGVDDLVPVA